MTASVARVAACLAIDPEGLGGVWIRARHGPRRDAIFAAFDAIGGTHARVMPETGETELFGGIDLSQSLFEGEIVNRRGLIERVDVLWLTRAERMPRELACRIGAALDRGACKTVILADESADPDELPPAALRERLAFFLCDAAEPETGSVPHNKTLLLAKARLADLAIPEPMIDAAARLTTRTGCTGSRPALFILRVARALAALDGSAEIEDRHLAEASRLVLAHRVGESPEDSPSEIQPQVDAKTSDAGETRDSHDSLLHDLVLEAARVTLPDGLLNALTAPDRRASGSGQGAEKTSTLRGRPLPSRPGTPDGRARLDLLATLHAAAPWQRLRHADPGRLSVRASDLRVRRYRERSERMLIFVVDASGSAAMARLAEAKGAAEALLAEAYRSRDHVSLTTFRGDTAETPLEPTRSLVRAKRLLAALPGGGATPLAAALQQAAGQAALARKKGLTPHVVLMTDGRANKALDGSTDRQKAKDDAMGMARHLRALGVPVLLVDSGLRPSSDLQQIAEILRAETIRLPRGSGPASAEQLLAALDA